MAIVVMMEHCLKFCPPQNEGVNVPALFNRQNRLKRLPTFISSLLPPASLHFLGCSAEALSPAVCVSILKPEVDKRAPGK